MGGRVAEKIVFGHLNSGAANDLEQATGIARRMVREWGMSDRVGPMAWSSQQHVFLGEDLMTSGREYSDETASWSTRRSPGSCTSRSSGPPSCSPSTVAGLDLVAEALLEHETIDGHEVARLIQQGLTESGDTEQVTLNISVVDEINDDVPVDAPADPAPARSTLREAPQIIPRPAAGA